MNFIDLYISYFEHQATAHPALAHSAASGGRVFEVMGLEESLGDVRTSGKEKDFIMRLIEYSYRITDEDAGQVRKFIEGGFIIAKYTKGRIDGKQGYLDALTDSEKVTDEIIEKMIADSLNGHPLFYHGLDSRQQVRVNPLPLIGDGSYSGWLCLFEIQNYWRNCTTDPGAPAWTDGGLTPFP